MSAKDEARAITGCICEAPPGLLGLDGDRCLFDNNELGPCGCKCHRIAAVIEQAEARGREMHLCVKSAEQQRLAVEAARNAGLEEAAELIDSRYMALIAAKAKMKEFMMTFYDMQNRLRAMKRGGRPNQIPVVVSEQQEPGTVSFVQVKGGQAVETGRIDGLKRGGRE